MATAIGAAMIAQASVWDDELLRGALIAIVSATLAFLSNYLLAQWRHRREPTHRLSYSVAIRRELGDVSDGVRRSLQVTYNGHPIEGIHSAKCAVINVGNTVVRDESLRFEFPPGSALMDAYVDPEPPKEVGLKRLYDDQLSPNEVKYLIGHMKVGQTVNFDFVVASDAERITVSLHNKGREDVDLVAGEAHVEREDHYHLYRFVLLIFLFAVVPVVARGLLLGLGAPVASILRLAFAVAMIPHIKPVARVLSRGLVRIGSVQQRSDPIGLRLRSEGDAVVVLNSPTSTLGTSIGQDATGASGLQSPELSHRQQGL